MKKKLFKNCSERKMYSFEDRKVLTRKELIEHILEPYCEIVVIDTKTNDNVAAFAIHMAFSQELRENFRKNCHLFKEKDHNKIKELYLELYSLSKGELV